MEIQGPNIPVCFNDRCYLIQSNYTTGISFWAFPEGYEPMMSENDVAIFRLKEGPTNVVELAERNHGALT